MSDREKRLSDEFVDSLRRLAGEERVSFEAKYVPQNSMSILKDDIGSAHTERAIAERGGTITYRSVSGPAHMFHTGLPYYTSADWPRGVLMDMGGWSRRVFTFTAIGLTLAWGESDFTVTYKIQGPMVERRMSIIEWIKARTSQWFNRNFG